MNDVRAAQPVAAERPWQDTTGGISFTDPYQWLEDDADPEVKHWESAQNAAARDHLRSAPAWKRLRDRVAELTFDPLRFAPLAVGKRWVRVTDPGVGRQVLVEVADSASAEHWEPVFDVRDHTDDPVAHVFVQARGNDTIRCYVAGGEALAMYFVNVADGSIAAAALGKADEISLSDGRKLRSATSAPEGRRRTSVWLTTADGVDESPVEIDDLEAFIRVSDDERVAWIEVDHLSPRPSLLRRLDRDGGWEPFVPAGEFYAKGFADAEGFTAVTTQGAANGRVVRIPLDAGQDPTRWSELVPAGTAIPVTVQRVGSRLVLAEIHDGHSRLRVLDLDGTEIGELPLPGAGTVNSFSSGGLIATAFDTFNAGADEIAFTFQSHTQPAAVYVGNPAELTVTATEPVAPLAGLVMHRDHVTSTDGATVGFTVIRREDCSFDEPRPLLLHGYGGFMIAHVPDFLGSWAAFVEAGGVFVHCNLRGGGELGPEWWQQGRMHRKQQTFDDLYAIAEHLVRTRVTTPGSMAVYGRSNGGLLASVAAVQRPDLFRAAISRVPVIDVNGIVRDPVGMMPVRDEYGDPSDPTDAAVLAAYNPYRNVVDGTEYPSVLLTSGRDDVLCKPWHSRKLAARLQAASSSGNPVLLRVWEDMAHAVGDLGTVVDWHTEELVFLFRELGVTVP